MSKSIRLGLGLFLVFLLLGVLPVVNAAPPAQALPDGGVPVNVKIKPGADLQGLKGEIESRGGKVLSLNPEGTLLVSMPSGKVKVLKVLNGVDDAVEADLSGASPAGDSGITGIRAMGLKKPSAEQIQEMEKTRVKVTSVEPNELAKARAQLNGKKSGGGDASIMLATAVDNSTSKYFPPVGDQGGQGSCSAWGTCYYWSTYTQAQDENLTASGGSTTVVNSPAFGYNLHNSGVDGGSWPDDIMQHFNTVGCATWAQMSYNDSDYTTWPSEAAWIGAMKNRTQAHFSIDGLSDAGLTNIKTHLANGGILVSTTDVYSNWNPTLVQNPSRGVDNGVLFSHAGESLLGAHCMAIVGYDDNRPYYNGSTTKYGAFMVVNSWGTGWGTTNTAGKRGFMWVAYDYFKADNWCFGFGLYNTDRDNYRTKLYAVAGLNQTKRGSVGFRGGLGADPNSPVFLETRVLDYYGGLSRSITDAKRVAADLNDAISSITDYNNIRLFVRLVINSDASAAGTVTSADFYHDFDGDGSFIMVSSSDPTVTVNPGNTGHATVAFSSSGGNMVPTANAGSDKSARVNEMVTFSGVGSSDPDSGPSALTYAWQFGDGATKSGCTVTHSYTATGSYTVTLTVDDGADTDSDTCKAEILPEVAPLAEWLMGSIHYHTTNSDGSESVQTMVTSYRDTGGQDFSCVTDHDYVSNAAQYSNANFLGINGVEASGSAHVLGLGMNTTGSFTPGASLQAEINNILNGGGLPIVAHPFWSNQYSGYDMNTLIKGMTGCKFIEVFNWYCQDLWSWGNSEAIWDDVLSDSKLIYATAGDDAHGWGRAGYTYNMVGAMNLSLSDLKTSLNAGDSYACYSTSKWNSGIALTAYTVTGTSAGDTITIDTDVGTTITFIGGNGATLKTVNSDNGSYTLDGNEGYVRIKITNTDGDVTWTQPVVIGGGVVPPPPPPVGNYEGYAPITTGGDGGRVVWVTSLSEGALQGAINSCDGTPTIIKFSVGGKIYCGGGIFIDTPNITIAGETAPSPGISLMAAGCYRPLTINTHDVIVRHIRCRNAPGENIQIFGDYNLIIDHCSVSNSADGGIDVNGGSHHVIISRNIIAGCVEGDRTYGKYTSYHHNLYTQNNRRQPKIVEGVGPFDFRNNVVEKWTNTGTNVQVANAINIINNAYGPPGPTESWLVALNVDDVCTNIYVAGNYCPGDPSINDKGNRSSPNEQPTVTTIDAGPALIDDVHKNSGALPRDATDEFYAGPAGNTPPVANAGPDVFGYGNEPVTFNGSGSYDTDGDQLTYVWNFGDGATASGAIVTHTYTAADTYMVILTVDDGEDTDTDSCLAEILAAGTPRAEAGPDRMAYLDDVVTFDGSGSFDPDQDPLSYNWNFGDGTTKSGCTVTKIYTVTGTYTVTLVVSDGTLSDDDTCKATARYNTAPVAAINPTNLVIRVNKTATWDGAGSSDADGDQLTYAWQFGDGATSSGMTVTHVYTVTGSYTCTLTVNDGRDSDSATGTVIVQPNFAPVPDAGPDQNGGIYAVVGFDGSGTDDANDDPLTYVWDFGDGHTAGTMIANHRFLNNGVYTVTLTASDDELSGTDTCVVTVSDSLVRWYYVDANLGNDSNEGTDENAPWKTLSKAVSTLGLGDGVKVKPGTYDGGLNFTNTNGDTKSPIIFQGRNDLGRVIIDATGDSYGFRSAKHYVVIRGFEIKNASGQGVMITSLGDYNIVCDVVSHNNTGSGIESNGKEDVLDNNLCYDNGGYGIIVSAGAGSVVNKCTVDNSTSSTVKLNDGDLKSSIATNGLSYGVQGSSTRTIKFSDVWNNAAGNYTGGCSAGSGTISTDPLFVNRGNKDFHLQGGSPCKNAAHDGKDMGYAYPAPYTNLAPIANAGPDQEKYVNDVVVFIGSNSYDPNNDPITYAWQFGDGGTASGATPSHQYTVTGVFTVTLTVSDGSLNASDTAKVTVRNQPLVYRSIAAEDGYTRESSETSNVGGFLDSSGNFRVGDHSANQQCIGVVSFDTSSIPDNATIVKVTLTLRRANRTGDPTVLGNLLGDIKNGYYGASSALANADFEAASTATAVCTLPYPASDGDYTSAELNSSGRSAVNKTGKTQMKIRFATDDDNDSSTDYLVFNDGSSGTASYRPTLEVIYE